MIQRIYRKLSDLTDIRGWAAGKYLRRKDDNSAFEWTSLNLNALEDVTISNPADGEALQYVSSASQWMNMTIATGGGTDYYGATTLFQQISDMPNYALSSHSHSQYLTATNLTQRVVQINGTSGSVSIVGGSNVTVSGLNGSITVHGKTDFPYIQTAQSSNFAMESASSRFLQASATTKFQLASEMSEYQLAGAYITTAMASNAGSNFINTSVSSAFELASNSSLFQQTSDMSSVARNNHTHSQYLTTAAQTDHSHAQYLSSQSVQTQNMVQVNGSTGSIVIAGGDNVTVSTNGSSIIVNGKTDFPYIYTSESSVFQQASQMSQYLTTAAVSDHSHSNYLVSQSIQTQGNLAAIIGGNTAGTTSSIQSGTLMFAGGANITLSQNGNNISIIGPTGLPAGGLPAGGTANQLLIKISDTDGDAEWATVTAADVGADPDGTASTAISNHRSDVAPHPNTAAARIKEADTPTMPYWDNSPGNDASYSSWAQLALVSDIPTNASEIGAVSASIIDIPYINLKALVDTSTLVIGQRYRFPYINTHRSSRFETPAVYISYTAEDLIVTALSANQLETQAYSEDFPEEIIYYDIKSSQLEGETTGHIWYRAWPLQHIEVYYDFRHCSTRMWARDADEALAGHFYSFQPTEFGYVDYPLFNPANLADGSVMQVFLGSADTANRDVFPPYGEPRVMPFIFRGMCNQVKIEHAQSENYFGGDANNIQTGHCSYIMSYDGVLTEGITLGENSFATFKAANATYVTLGNRATGIFEGSVTNVTIPTGMGIGTITTAVANKVFDWDFIPLTYGELKALVNSSKLEVGSSYKITDHQTSYIVDDTLDPDQEGNWLYGTTEVLIVRAISANQLDRVAVSVDFPEDIIYYDINGWGLFYGQKFGAITYREDTKRSIAKWEDWRNVMYPWTEAVVGSNQFVHEPWRGINPETLIYFTMLNEDFLNQNVRVGLHSYPSTHATNPNGWHATPIRFNREAEKVTFEGRIDTCAFVGSVRNSTIGHCSSIKCFGNVDGMRLGENNVGLTFKGAIDGLITMPRLDSIIFDDNYTGCVIGPHLETYGDIEGTHVAGNYSGAILGMETLPNTLNNTDLQKMLNKDTILVGGVTTFDINDLNSIGTRQLDLTFRIQGAWAIGELTLENNFRNGTEVAFLCLANGALITFPTGILTIKEQFLDVSGYDEAYGFCHHVVYDTYFYRMKYNERLVFSSTDDSPLNLHYTDITQPVILESITGDNYPFTAPYVVQGWEREILIKADNQVFIKIPDIRFLHEIKFKNIGNDYSGYIYIDTLVSTKDFRNLYTYGHPSIAGSKGFTLSRGEQAWFRFEQNNMAFLCCTFSTNASLIADLNSIPEGDLTERLTVDNIPNTLRGVTIDGSGIALGIERFNHYYQIEYLSGLDEISLTNEYNCDSSLLFDVILPDYDGAIVSLPQAALTVFNKFKTVTNYNEAYGACYNTVTDRYFLRLKYLHPVRILTPTDGKTFIVEYVVPLPENIGAAKQTIIDSTYTKTLTNWDGLNAGESSWHPNYKECLTADIGLYTWIEAQVVPANAFECTWLYVTDGGGIHTKAWDIDWTLNDAIRGTAFFYISDGSEGILNLQSLDNPDVWLEASQDPRQVLTIIGGDSNCVIFIRNHDINYLQLGTRHQIKIHATTLTLATNGLRDWNCGQAPWNISPNSGLTGGVVDEFGIGYGRILSPEEYNDLVETIGPVNSLPEGPNTVYALNSEGRRLYSSTYILDFDHSLEANAISIDCSNFNQGAKIRFICNLSPPVNHLIILNNANFSGQDTASSDYSVIGKIAYNTTTLKSYFRASGQIIDTIELQAGAAWTLSLYDFQSWVNGQIPLDKIDIASGIQALTTTSYNGTSPNNLTTDDLLMIFSDNDATMKKVSLDQLSQFILSTIDGGTP